MLRLAKVAVPVASVDSVVVPESVPPLGFVEIASVTGSPVIARPPLLAKTLIAAMVWPAAVFEGCAVKLRIVLAGGLTTSLRLAAAVTPPAVTCAMKL